MWKLVRRVIFHIESLVSKAMHSGDRCHVCGYIGEFIHNQVLWPSLVEEWKLDLEFAEYFNDREGISCPRCNASLRSQSLSVGLLKGIREIYGVQGQTLQQAVRDIGKCWAGDKLIAEINSAGSLHNVLQAIPDLCYSEYSDRQNDIPSQDIQKLTYGNDVFSIVITSETLEHIPNLQLAISEIHRVLVPGGLHIFTIPVHVGREYSLRRAEIVNNSIVHLCVPSYHGSPNTCMGDFLVFHEFGKDIFDYIESFGFDIEFVQVPDCDNPTVFCLYTRKRCVG